MSQTRVIIPGSGLPPRAAVTMAVVPDAPQILSASILLRRAAVADSSATSREEIENSLSASPTDVESVSAFARHAELSILEVSRPRRTIRVQGTVAQFEKAFGTVFQTERSDSGATYLTYTGTLTIPSDLDGVVIAVLGLDQRPAARSR